MLNRHKILFLILAVILIPILLGMTPLNLVKKFSSGWPLSNCKQTLRGDFCLFNSLISHDDLTIGILNSTLLMQDLMPSLHFQTLILPSSGYSSYLSLVPLRC
jgi:hypothetical protein